MSFENLPEVCYLILSIPINLLRVFLYRVFFDIKTGTSSKTNSFLVQTILRAWMGHRNWGWHEHEIRVINKRLKSLKKLSN